MRRFYITFTVCSLLSIFLAIKFSAYVALTQIQQISGSLQNVALGLFTLAGIWIAYIYPEAINAYAYPNKVTRLRSDDSTDRVESLIFIILCSAISLVFVLAFNIVIATLNNYPYVIENKIFFKITGIFFLLLISSFQIIAVWQIFINNFLFLKKLVMLRTNAKIDDDL
ncbi:hypothetical protein VXS05_17045 [Photobacterium toruni]|uniref:hypothetical protein n=1 Tax=Photobacterium toruni TaxID=1935446 RepID=UPI002E195626|nr:hypothetical protein [Photobacterium toruni]